MRPLLPALLTAALLLAAINLLIGGWSHRLPYYRKLDAVRDSQNPNLVFIGNSLLDGRVDENAFAKAARGADYRPLNSALGATRPPEQELLFDYSTQSHPGIRTLVLGFFDLQLTTQDQSRVTDLTGNRMVGIDRRFPASEVASVYKFGMLDRMELEAIRYMPMAANRANLWKYVELLRRSMEAMGMPPIQSNGMGRVADLAALEFGSLDSFDAQARTFIAHPDHFDTNYESMISQAHRSGMNIVILLMPMSPYHQATFYERPIWRQYIASVKALADRSGIRWIDASGWLPAEDDFVDHLHMSQDAAHNFSVRLGEALSESTDPEVSNRGQVGCVNPTMGSPAAPSKDKTLQGRSPEGCK
jgi:hypothetical protein